MNVAMIIIFALILFIYEDAFRTIKEKVIRNTMFLLVSVFGVVNCVLEQDQNI